MDSTGSLRVDVVHWIPLTEASGCLGILLMTREANPLARVRDTLDKRWAVVVPSSWPVWRARARPSRLNWSTMVWCRPPRDSATRGTKARAPGAPARAGVEWSKHIPDHTDVMILFMTL